MSETTVTPPVVEQQQPVSLGERFKKIAEKKSPFNRSKNIGGLAGDVKKRFKIGSKDYDRTMDLGDAVILSAMRPDSDALKAGNYKDISKGFKEALKLNGIKMTDKSAPLAELARAYVETTYGQDAIRLTTAETAKKHLREPYLKIKAVQDKNTARLEQEKAAFKSRFVEPVKNKVVDTLKNDPDDRPFSFLDKATPEDAAAAMSTLSAEDSIKVLAGVSSTAQREAIWSNLTPEIQQQIMDINQTSTDPAVSEAVKELKKNLKYIDKARKTDEKDLKAADKILRGLEKNPLGIDNSLPMPEPFDEATYYDEVMDNVVSAEDKRAANTLSQDDLEDLRANLTDQDPPELDDSMPDFDDDQQDEAAKEKDKQTAAAIKKSKLSPRALLQKIRNVFRKSPQQEFNEDMQAAVEDIAKEEALKEAVHDGPAVDRVAIANPNLKPVEDLEDPIGALYTKKGELTPVGQPGPLPDAVIPQPEKQQKEPIPKVQAPESAPMSPTEQAIRIGEIIQNDPKSASGALIELQDLLDKDPYNAEIYYALSHAEYALGDKDKAHTYFEQGLSLDPNAPEKPKPNQTPEQQQLDTIKRYEKAAETPELTGNAITGLKDVIQKSPDNEQAYWALGRILWNQGKQGEAQQYFWEGDRIRDAKKEQLATAA